MKLKFVLKPILLVPLYIFGALLEVNAQTCSPPTGFLPITTVGNLLAMQRDKNYYLCNDLDLSGYNYLPRFSEACTSLQPALGFQGVLEGNNKTISNLSLTATSSSLAASACAGLFAQIGPSGEVRNLHLRRSTVSAITSVGSLAGRNAGKVINVRTLDASIRGGSRVGGLVGWNNGVIERSSARATVDYTPYQYHGGFYFGGLTGLNGGSIFDSSSDGSVRGYDTVGGLVGFAQSPGFTGRIGSSSSSSIVSATLLAGGLVGQSEAPIERSFATGDVTVTYGRVGGLVGYNRHWISRSYATGNVKSATSSEVGGLVGLNTEGSGASPFSGIQNCYASGSVSGGSYVGGLVGSNTGSVMNSFSLGKVTGASVIGGLIGSGSIYSTATASYFLVDVNPGLSSAGGEGKTAVQLKTITTFQPAWDISSSYRTNAMWRISSGSTAFPRLQ